MKKLLRLIAVAVLGLGVATGGLVSAQSAAVDTTGPDSTVTIDFDDEYDATVNNAASVGLAFDNTQAADSGEATTRLNTSGGDAVSGDAMNESDVMVEGEIDNRGANAVLAGGWDMGDREATVENTGPRSDVDIDFDNDYEVELNNTTNLSITNDNTQRATSGDATVSTNTTGGDAETGDAHNSSTSSFSFTVRN